MSRWTRRDKQYIREVKANGHVLVMDARAEHNRVVNSNQRAKRRDLRCDLRVSEWFLLLAYYRFSCAYCERPYEVLGHIIPLANGGGTTATNTLPLCVACNDLMGTAVWLPARCGG